MKLQITKTYTNSGTLHDGYNWDLSKPLRVPIEGYNDSTGHVISGINFDLTISGVGGPEVDITATPFFDGSAPPAFSAGNLHSSVTMTRVNSCP